MLETGWRNYQVGNLAFKTGLFVAIYYFFIGRIAWRIVDLNLGWLSTHPVCHFSAAQLECGPSPKTLSFFLSSLNAHLSFPMGCSAIFLANVSPRSNIASFLHDVEVSFPYLPPPSLKFPHFLPAMHTTTSNSSDSFPGTPHMSTFSLYLWTISNQLWLSLQSWCCYAGRKIWVELICLWWVANG